MSGWYAMKRGWLDNDVLHPVGKWSRAEAWVWLVENAAYKDTSIDLGGKPHIVRRGDLCHSLRFIAGQWHWSTKAVSTFIRDLEAHGTVRSIVIKGGHAGETKRTQLTLCNYEKYQSPGNGRETREKRTGNKEEQGNNLTTLPPEEADASPTHLSIITKSVWDEGKRLLTRHGVRNPGSLIGRWLKDSEPIQILSAIDAAHKAQTQDPVPYITEVLNGGSNDRYQSSKFQSANGPQNRSDPALDQISRLAGLVQTPGNGGR